MESAQLPTVQPTCLSVWLLPLVVEGIALRSAQLGGEPRRGVGGRTVDGYYVPDRSEY